MSHPWQHLVVGGVGDPRFLKCGTEECLNSSFEADTVGWGITTGASIVRMIDTLALWGNYSAKITAHGDIDECAYCGTVTAPIIDGKKFILTLWMRADTSTEATIALRTNPNHVSLDNVGERVNPVIVTGLSSAEWTFVVVEGKCPAGQTSQYLEVIIWPFDINDGTLNPSTEYSIFVDEVSIRETLDDVSMSSVTMVMTNGFDNVLKARHNMLDGSEKESRLGIRFTCSMEYEYLSAADEVIRRVISTFQTMLFFPHDDMDWAYLVNMDSFTSGYPWNRYLGHTGGIKLSSVKVFKVVPIEILDEGS